MNALIEKNSTEIAEAGLFNEVNVFDLQRFEQVNRVAAVMASASLIPDHLKGPSHDVTFGNCFQICNLAANWGLDPFAVAQASSLVFGKIVLEGKLVRAVIKKYLNFDLNYAWFGNAGDMQRRCYVSDRPLVKVSDDERENGRPLTEDEIKTLLKLPGWRITTGSLQKWHTKNKSGGVNDNWVKDEDKMFRERGAREWCREFSPGLMLGVYTPDEFDEMEVASRASRARDITPANNPLLDDKARNTEAQASTAASTPPSGRKSGPDTESAAPASDKPSASADGGPGNADASTPAQQDSSLSSVGSEQRNSTPQAGGSSPSASTTDDAPISHGRAFFEEFSGALVRARQAESLPKAKDAFFKGKGIEVNEADKRLLQTIYKAHEDRIKGNLDATQVLTQCRQWIEEDVPEDAL